MKLVATFNLGGVWYAQHTVPYMRKYAAHVNADFTEFTAFDNVNHYPAKASWLRLEVLRLFAEQSHYDSLVILDLDVLVLPGCPDLFERVGSRLLAVQDMGMPFVSPRYIEWCVRNLAERPSHARYINAGVLAMSLQTARELSPLLEGRYPYSPYMEQDLLNLRAQNHLAVEFLPVEFNWLAPQFIEGALEKHMVHFVGSHKQLLPEFTALVAQQERRSTN